MVEWWSGGVVEWWSGGVVEWWSGGVVEWWSIGVVEYWSGGVVGWWRLITPLDLNNGIFARIDGVRFVDGERFCPGTGIPLAF